MTNLPELTQHLPNLELDSTQGRLNLNQFTGHLTLLYFYPKDMTSGCTVQAQDFRDLYAEFTQLNVSIYGVSRDCLKSHEKFIAKEHIPFVLISDSDAKLCHLFDVVKTKTMYGKPVQGIERSTFLFDKHGQLIHSWRKVKAAGHAQTVFNFIQDNYSDPLSR